MQIISGSLIAFAITLAVTQQVLASDSLYAPERVRNYATFNRCVAALKTLHKREKATEMQKVEETTKSRSVFSLRVSELTYPSKRKASYTVSGITRVIAKPPSRGDGGTVGWFTDWYCEARTMWKSGGHSAWVRDPVPPELAPIPSPPANN
jgi:hypothetical protein